MFIRDDMNAPVLKFFEHDIRRRRRLLGEDPAAHGHWCAFTDLYHTIPYHKPRCPEQPEAYTFTLII